MWRIWNKLFGWQYVLIKFGWDDVPARLRFDGNGKPFVLVCDTYLPLVDGAGNWVPLTFWAGTANEKPEAQ